MQGSVVPNMRALWPCGLAALRPCGLGFVARPCGIHCLGSSTAERARLSGHIGHFEKISFQMSRRSRSPEKIVGIRQKSPRPSLSYHFSGNLGTAQGEASIGKSKLHRPTTAKGFQDLATLERRKAPTCKDGKGISTGMFRCERPRLKRCRKTWDKDIPTFWIQFKTS